MKCSVANLQPYKYGWRVRLKIWGHSNTGPMALIRGTDFRPFSPSPFSRCLPFCLTPAGNNCVLRSSLPSAFPLPMRFRIFHVSFHFCCLLHLLLHLQQENHISVSMSSHHHQHLTYLKPYLISSSEWSVLRLSNCANANDKFHTNVPIQFV